ncbi:MAG: hypothetical protein RQ741_10785 [Wenzhouxiangellaceae bacterium]|nr:hypothetical protein [Wenzhouxiangellaceae bacterium]
MCDKNNKSSCKMPSSYCQVKVVPDKVESPAHSDKRLFFDAERSISCICEAHWPKKRLLPVGEPAFPAFEIATSLVHLAVGYWVRVVAAGGNQ